MITEIASIEVKSGMASAFETGVKNALPVFQRAKGCRGVELSRSIENRTSIACSFPGRRWRITPSTSAARPTFRSGENWSAIVSPRRRRSSTSHKC